MTTIEAKSKKKLKEARYNQAIEDFKLWLEKNPDWTHGEKFEAFDKACDQAIRKVK